MPKAQRGTPPYMQIQDHYRERLRSGEIAEGDRLPSIALLAEEWGVAAETAAKAIRGLQVEGYVYTSNRGTYATVGKGAAAGVDLAMHRDRTAASGQRIQIIEADLRRAPIYVAELFGLASDAAMVARIETVAYIGAQPARLTVQWWPGELVPELDGADESDVLERIERTTGRRSTHGRDYFEAREADVREARALGIRSGDPVLASTYVWSDETGVIEYGEFVLPKKRVVSFPYTIGGA